MVNMDDLKKAINNSANFLQEIYGEDNIEKIYFEGFKQVEKKHEGYFCITLSYKERVPQPSVLYSTVWHTKTFKVDNFHFEVLSMEKS